MRGIIIGIPISLVMWAVIIYGVMCATAKAMDGIQQAAIYSVDKAECRLYVPDEWIKRALASAMIQYNLTLEQAIEQAGSLGTAIQMNVRESGLAGQYCARRVAQ